MKGGHNAHVEVADIDLKSKMAANTDLLSRWMTSYQKMKPGGDLRLEIKVIYFEPEFGFDAYGGPVSSLALFLSSVSSIKVDNKPKQPIQHQFLLDAITKLIGDNCANRDTILTQLKTHGHNINDKALTRAFSALVDDGVLYKPDRTL